MNAISVETSAELLKVFEDYRAEDSDERALCRLRCSLTTYRELVG